MEGAWRAEAEVVVFLDSHIEAYGLVCLALSDPKTFTSKFSKNSDSGLWCTRNIWLRVAVVSFQTPFQAPGKMAKTQVGVTDFLVRDPLFVVRTCQD